MAMTTAAGGRCPLWLTVLLLLGLDAAGAQEAPQVVIQRLDNGRWRATWELAEPAPVLRFERPAEFYRERVWTVVTEGYRFGRTQGRQTLEIMDGAAARARITVEFPQYTRPIPKEYELFQPFGDGAVAMYTGHFYASPRGGVSDSSWIRTLRLTPPAGARAIVRGESHDGAFRWTDPLGDGTYIYLGTTSPIETADLVAIVDPRMPRWLADEMHARLPQLFATYAERFDAGLPWKPLVFYSFDDVEAPGLSSSGGTLTGLIQMTLIGSAWREPGPDATEHAFQFLAHEAVHLWNGQLVSSSGGGGSWMHEGSANAIARDLLLESGITDAEGHRAGRELALNQCFVALALGDGPVATAHERGAFRVFYDCGELMALWTDAEVRRASPGATLFTFWRDLIAAARADRNRYTEDTYFRVLGDAGVPERAVAAMRAFLTADTPVPIATRGLADAGVRLEPGHGAPPPTLGHELVRRVVGHLMRAMCGGRMSFWSGDPVVTAAIDDCPPFATRHEVHGIQGVPVGGDAAALFDAVAAACAAGDRIRLAGRDDTVLADFACGAPLGARPAWYALRP